MRLLSVLIMAMILGCGPAPPEYPSLPASPKTEQKTYGEDRTTKLTFHGGDVTIEVYNSFEYEDRVYTVFHAPGKYSITFLFTNSKTGTRPLPNDINKIVDDTDYQEQDIKEMARKFDIIVKKNGITEKQSVDNTVPEK